MNGEIAALWQQLKCFGQTVFQEAENASKPINEDALAICYFIKAENTAYSIMILLDRCFIQDAGILARSLFENVIYLIASTQDKGFMKRFSAEFDVQKNKLLERSEKHHQMTGQELPIGEVKIKEIKEKAQDAKGKKDQFEKGFLENLCKKFSSDKDLEKDYNMLYKNFHGETHSLPPAVRKHSSNTGFVHYPDLETSDLTAFITFEYFLKASKAIIDYFQIPLKERLEELRAAYEALGMRHVQERNEIKVTAVS